MAAVVIDPATLDPNDPRPIFDTAHLPGGPWRTYRVRKVVDAVRVNGAFLVRRADGMLIEQSDRWVTIDQATGAIQLTDPALFAETYVLDE